MLIIIHEKKYSEYTKVKSNTKPSEFCKRVFKYSSVKSINFVGKYFSNIDDLIKAIKEYKRIANISDDEKCLADLLKE